MVYEFLPMEPKIILNKYLNVLNLMNKKKKNPESEKNPGKILSKLVKFISERDCFYKDLYLVVFGCLGSF